MKKRLSLWVFLLATFTGWTEEIPITILDTTDLHAHVFPTTDYEGHENVGGCARIATAIQKIRATTPNVLLVDAGDTIQGAPIGFLSSGQVMIKYLNYLHYDAWVLGNHEFDWGLEKLGACVEKATVPVVTANVRRSTAVTNAFATSLTKILLSYRIVEVQGVHVALIGLTTPNIPNWSRPRLINGLQFEAPVQTLQRIIPEVKAKGAQILVLVTHQGYRESGDDQANQLNAVASEFPELDVIVGGHTHRVFSEYKIQGVLYNQAGYWGTHLGRIDFMYDSVQKKIVQKHATVIPMDESVAMDPQFLALVKPELDFAREEASRVLGAAEAEFSPRTGSRRETPIHNLIGAAVTEALQRKGVMVDAVFHALLDEKAYLAGGPITVGEVWRIMPYENTLAVAELLPGELREIMEESAKLYERGQFRGLYGLRLRLKPSAPAGQRIISMTDRGGKELDPNKRLKVAFNSFDLASAGTRLTKLREICDRPDSRLQEFDLQTRQAVMDYIRAHKTIKPETFGWWTIASAR